MKNKTNYFKIKWGSFLLTFLLLSLGIIAAFLLTPKNSTTEAPTPIVENSPSTQLGHFSNETFAQLIEENLSELGFINEITFEGEDEGRFILSGTLCNPARLSALCPELAPFEAMLNALKNEEISIYGHLGENEAGYGKFITDTIQFSGYTIPAGVATEYIEEYTGLNDLLEVPFDDIEINRLGVQFKSELPLSIQTAVYTQQEPSLSGED